MTERKRNLFFSKSGNLAFAVVVLASFVVVLTARGLDLSWVRITFLLGLGLVYFLVGTRGWDSVDASPSPLRLLAYFAVQLAISYAANILASGYAWLLLLPLVAHAVTILPRWGVITVSVLVLAGQLLPYALVDNNLLNLLSGGFSFLAAVVFTLVFTQITVGEQQARAEAQRLAEELGAANRKLSEYALQAEELAIARERNRLAREIHDGLGHYLTAVNMQVKAALAVLDQEPELARSALGKAQGLAEEALMDVRRSVAALRAGPAMERPLAEGLQRLVDEASAAGLQADFSLLGAPRPLKPQAELALYRAVQEGLTNVRKHAQASRVSVALDYGDQSCVRLTVEDDGAGTQEPGGGFGLLGLRERAQLVGGSLQVTTAPGEGFRLALQVPG